MAKPDPSVDLEQRLRTWDAMSVRELRATFTTTFCREPPARVGRRLLLLAIAHKAQTDAFGRLSHRARRALEKMGDEGKPSQGRVALKPGAMLLRDWQGESHRVEVLPDGIFAWRGRRWRSLSAIARAITGTNRGGPAFFGLRGGGSHGAA